MTNYLIIENTALKIKHIEIIDIDGKTCISKAVSGQMIKNRKPLMLSLAYIC